MYILLVDLGFVVTVMLVNISIVLSNVLLTTYLLAYNINIMKQHQV